MKTKLPIIVSLIVAIDALAGSATWKNSPTSPDWNTAANWTPATVPNGASDTATFAISSKTRVSLSDNTLVNGIVFEPGASAFTITVPLDSSLEFDGVGITNNSGITQKFVIGSPGFQATINFDNSATAGSGTGFTLTGDAGYATIYFFTSSSAGSGAFTLNGLSADTNAPLIGFFGTSTAARGTFAVDGSALAGKYGGDIYFSDTSTAANGIFTFNGGTARHAYGGYTEFDTTSSAGRATLIANGGTSGGFGGSIFFESDSTGGTARLEVFDNGSLDISLHNLPGITIGSIEGNGDVFLGANKLTVGSNNLSTNFSGLIQDGGLGGGTGGSLTKIGTRKLVLTHGNNYSGGTVIEQGNLMVNNRSGSGTGSGPVQVNGGRLGGKGIIAGGVTVGTGAGSGAVLAPGYVHGFGSPGALAIQSPLTFSADATYNVDVNSSSANADEVIANGVTIDSGAQFSFADLGSGTLTAGTVFTVINNTAATPIAGTFSNLADGSTMTVGSNNFQANYEGGDGNDLTLTVVP